MSGLSDTDYPGANQFNLPDLYEMMLVRRSPLPGDLVDQFTSKFYTVCLPMTGVVLIFMRQKCSQIV